MVNITYIIIFKTRVMDKAYEQWKEMPVIQKTCQAFKNHLAKSYMHYNTHKKSTAASHINGTAANHAQEKYTQRMTADALQSLSNMTIEDKKSMANLTSINLTLSKSLTHPQEKYCLSLRICRHYRPIWTPRNPQLTIIRGKKNPITTSGIM